MKRILLTTTSLVLAAGVAQADITWSGTATAGMAKTGKVKASTAVAVSDTTIKTEGNRDGIAAATALTLPSRARPAVAEPDHVISAWATPAASTKEVVVRTRSYFYYSQVTTSKYYYY